MRAVKVRDSGMPEEFYWSTFFNPRCVVEKLDCAESCRGLVEFGCGYGLFTVAAARLVRGPVFALDIEPEMVAATAEKVRKADLANVVVEQRDFIGQGCGRPDSSIDHAMLFNILHLEDPVGLIQDKADPGLFGTQKHCPYRQVHAHRRLTLQGAMAIARSRGPWFY